MDECAISARRASVRGLWSVGGNPRAACRLSAAGLLLLLLLLLSACDAAAPLPTRAAPAATVNTPPPATSGGVLPSRTPAPTPTVLPSPTNEPTPTASPTSVPTPEPPPPTPTAAPTEPPLCAEPGRVEQASFPSAITGEPHAYRIYLPPCYGTDGRAYPMLIMLGGNIHDERYWDELGLDEAAEAAIAAARIPPLLIVMPDGGWIANDTTSGPASYEGLILNELIPAVEAGYCAWPAAAGRAIGGISRGGYWSLEIAFRHATTFRSVGAHSPALIDAFAGPAEDPVVTGATNDLGDLRIYIDIGNGDPYLPKAQPLHEALLGAAVAHTWLVNPGNHLDAYWQSHLDDYLDWYSAGWPAERELLPACGE